MGMAASQARLLSITSRIHDVEYQAQNIQSQKIALATQKDEVYNEYMAALDAKKIQVKFNDGTSSKMVDATYATVCGYQEGRDGTFAMVDAASGMMIVEPEVEEAYNTYGNDKYSFAWAMMGFEQQDFAWADNAWEGDGTQVGIRGNEGFDGEGIDIDGDGSSDFIVRAFTDVEQEVFNKHKDDTDLSSLYSKYEKSLESKDKKEIQTALYNLRDKLYSKYQSEIYNYMRLDKPDNQDEATKEETITNGIYKKGFEDFDASMANEFKYYVQLFEGIQEAGGCMTIDDFAKDGDTGNEWFNNIIKSGKAILMEYNTTGTKRGWNEISIATTTKLDEVNDTTNEKKAEAKYEHELNIINKKDTKYDQDLSKLETERTALTKEYDSIKQVKDDNIDRTFKIFS